MAQRRYKHTTAKQVGGDDGYQWTIFVHGRERLNGLTRAEVPYYRDKFEREEEAKQQRFDTREAHENFGS